MASDPTVRQRVTRLRVRHLLLWSVLAGYSVVLYVTSLDLNRNARFFPQIVLAVMAVLLVLKLITVLFPRVGARLEPDVRAFDLPEREHDVDPDGAPVAVGAATPQRSPLLVWGATAALAVSFMTLGFVPTLLAGVFLYLRALEGVSLRASTFVTLATFAFVYLIFFRLMRVPLYWGIFEPLAERF